MGHGMTDVYYLRGKSAFTIPKRMMTEIVWKILKSYYGIDFDIIHALRV